MCWTSIQCVLYPIKKCLPWHVVPSNIVYNVDVVATHNYNCCRGSGTTVVGVPVHIILF